MTLRLFYHPLASYCHKVLIALYENGTEFDPCVMHLMQEAERERFLAMWPVGKMPVLRDEQRDQTVPETSIIIEYLDRHHPGPRPMLPSDPELCLTARLWDRFFDLYVQDPMQRIVADRLKPEERRDPAAVEEQTQRLLTAYGVIEQHMKERTWGAGDAFSIADCSAAPALFYAHILVPFEADQPALSAYFERLLERPSFARVLQEAQPLFEFFPFKERMPIRFLPAAGS